MQDHAADKLHVKMPHVEDTTTGFANDDVPMGVPSGGRPPWLIPVIVGVAALVLGGGLVMALAR